jgi:hypothetical protein
MTDMPAMKRPFLSRAATFAAGATLVALLVVVAAPLARVVRRDPAGVLRAEAAGAGGSRQTLTARRLLVGGEIALAVVLLVGGTLLARTLLRYAAADPGFDTGGLVMATVYLPPSSSGAADGAEFYRRLVERASALPGVSGVTLAQTAPNAGFARTLKAAPAGTAGGELQVAYNLVGTGYLTTLGVPMVAGRDLDARDRPGSAPVAVISRALAEKLWGDPARALGRRLRVDLPPRPGQAGPEFEVVGVSANAGVTSPAEPARPWIFLAYGQRILPRMQLVLRTTAPQARLEPELRDAVAAIRVDASIIEVLSASGQLSRALQGPRMNARIAGGLAIARVEFLAAVHRDEEELGLHGELAANVLIGVVPRPRQTGLLPERDRRLGVGHLEGADLDAHSGESARSAASAAGSVHRMPS